MINIMNKIRQLIKQVASIAIDKDESVYPVNQIFYLGKTATTNRLSVYGYCYNPPPNTFGLSFSSQGKESTKFTIFNEMTKRTKGLKAGEIIVHNPETGSYVFFKEDGSLYINGNGDVNINATGNINFNAGGDINMNANSVKHDDVKIDKTHIHGNGNPGGYLAPSGGGNVSGCSGVPGSSCSPVPE